MLARGGVEQAFPSLALPLEALLQLAFDEPSCLAGHGGAVGRAGQHGCLLVLGPVVRLESSRSSLRGSPHLGHLPYLAGRCEQAT
ncbi:hypothetical protein EAO79_06120 [Plantibacter sp. PA-3-X8]|nr:hypothetical protein EAO79_06120 [Plantibacter sp. PA-3-X8]